MQYLEGSGTPVLYIGLTVLKFNYHHQGAKHVGAVLISILKLFSRQFNCASVGK